MTLNFQNRIVFPAPEHSYTPETAFGQVIYIPRDLRIVQQQVKDKQEATQKLQEAALKKQSESTGVVASVEQHDDQSSGDEKSSNSSLKEEEKGGGWENLTDKPLMAAQMISAASERDLSQVEHIPCLFLPIDDGARKILIYFHGNAEDIGLAYDFLYQMGHELKMHVLAVEFSGYGLYKTSGPSEEKIKEDSEIIMEFLTKSVGIREQDIILFGRSMGTGPATHLSSEYNAYSLLLMSPYTSIKDVSRSLFGRFSFMITPLVYERFRNIDSIQRSRCPVFFLHGMKDKLIPHSHSIELNNVCSSVSFLHMPKDMDHNVFDFDDDLIKPFKEFLKKIDDSIASEARRAKGQVAKQVRQLIKIDESHVTYRDGPNSLKAAKINNGEDTGSNEAESSEEEEDNQYDLKASGDKFEINFDKILYEPPQIIKINHAKLEALAKSQQAIKNAQKNPNQRW